MESTPDKDRWNDNKGLRILQNHNLVDKTTARLERINFNFESSSTVGKILSNSTECYRELAGERKSQLTHQTLLLSYFKKLKQSPQSSATTTLIIQQPLTLRQKPPSAKH